MELAVRDDPDFLKYFQDHTFPLSDCLLKKKVQKPEWFIYYIVSENLTYDTSKIKLIDPI